jgi:hypothetical protein
MHLVYIHYICIKLSSTQQKEKYEPEGDKSHRNGQQDKVERHRCNTHTHTHTHTHTNKQMVSRIKLNVIAVTHEDTQTHTHANKWSAR